MTLRSPKDIYLPKWWWSKQPFWKYEDASKRGWGHLVEIHPGMFNLAWASAGAVPPPPDYVPFAPSIAWVYNEAAHIPMGGRRMTDWAFMLPPEVFLDCLLDDKARLKRWKFHTRGMSYERVVQMVRGCLLADRA